MNKLIILLCLVMICGCEQRTIDRETSKRITEGYIEVLQKDIQREQEGRKATYEKCKDPELAEYIMVLELLADSIGSHLQCPAYVTYVNWRDYNVTDIEKLKEIFIEAQQSEMCR